MEMGSHPSLSLPVLHRLVLSKYLIREAKAQLQHSSNDLALSLAVVSLHDGIDNLLGAIASHLGVDLTAKSYLLTTYDAISKAAKGLSNKNEVDQLNTLRVDIKHKGLVPNPKVVLALAPVLEDFCNQISQRFFGETLVQLSLVDAIERRDLRDEMRRIEGQVEAGSCKEALESMALVMFHEFDRDHIRGARPLDSLLLGPQPLPETQKRVFPTPSVDYVHRVFLEIGIEPDLYYRFHNLVPKVGYDNLRDRNVILEKDRYTWHERNWTTENCWFCFDFLISYFVRRQKRYRGYTIVWKLAKDRITFIRDSTIYELRDGLSHSVAVKAGTSLFGTVKDYVDGEWQGDPENLFVDILLSGEGPTDSRMVHVLKADVEVFVDHEVTFLPTFTG